MKMKIPTSSAGNGYYGYESLLQETLGELHEGVPNATPEDLQSPAGEDFSEYMWMEHEEEFDKQVMQQLEEEALMQQCMEAMLDEEQDQNSEVPPNWESSSSNSSSETHLSHSLRGLKVHDDVATHSSLNPNAAEFVPRQFRAQVQSPPTNSSNSTTSPPSPTSPQVSSSLS